MGARNYRDLHAWQKAMDLCEQVYRASREFPQHETYGLRLQMRRAALSVPSNIAEGQGRGSDREWGRFLSIAHGSLRELETQVLLAARLGYLDSTSTEALMLLASEVGRLINGLRRTLGNG
ncbi:four helix bundle protein [Fontivita pretiosa]|uniref:four helix bundle protein n=1 Tax=Fontivita pretiosa TaxID=2989684 RepID=UPI003D1815AD